MTFNTQQALQLMGFGIPTVFFVLALFIITIVALGKIFPGEKD